MRRSLRVVATSTVTATAVVRVRRVVPVVVTVTVDCRRSAGSHWISGGTWAGGGWTRSGGVSVLVDYSVWSTIEHTATGTITAVRDDLVSCVRNVLGIADGHFLALVPRQFDRLTQILGDWTPVTTLLEQWINGLQLVPSFKKHHKQVRPVIFKWILEYTDCNN